MNSFGRVFRISLFGESHGPSVGVLVDGCPAGLPVVPEDFEPDLARRRPGARGTTGRQEPDLPDIQSGVFEGRSTGAPILIRFANLAQKEGTYDRIRDTPRPGHADFTAWKKTGGYNDHRGGGHFSGRLTVGLVAAGVLAKKVIAPTEVRASLVEAGGDSDIEEAVKRALASGDSIGGVVACEASGVPAGLGEPFFDAAESLLAHLVLSIPAVRAIGFGAGFAAAGMTGRRHNDPILGPDGRTETNNAGGINGGITNGNPVLFRVAVKPTPTIPAPQRTVDLKTGRPAEVVGTAGRHDVCIALRVPVIVEAAAAVVLADLMLLEQSVRRVWRGAGDRS